jgi:hypothetical protein
MHFQKLTFAPQAGLSKRDGPVTSSAIGHFGQIGLDEGPRYSDSRLRDMGLDH